MLGRSSKRLLERLSRGLSQRLIRLRLWSDWVYSLLVRGRGGRNEVRENPNHRAKSSPAAPGRRGEAGGGIAMMKMGTSQWEDIFWTPGLTCERGGGGTEAKRIDTKSRRSFSLLQSARKNLMIGLNLFSLYKHPLS